MMGGLLRQRAFCYRALVVVVALLYFARIHDAHNDAAPAAPCPTDRGVTVEAAYRPGLITLDADSKDWADVKGEQFELLPATNPDPAAKYPLGSGSIQIKAVHDGRDIFFNLEFPGDYFFKDGVPENCPSVALMFGVGDDATYDDMGGCKQNPADCSAESCHGFDVDIMHFTISTAIPGRLYGANLLDNVNGTGADRFGSLVDMYAWSPHCKYLDGAGPNAVEGSGAQNDWQGAWTHTSIELDYGLVKSDSPFSTDGQSGFYIFEFSRPLRTSDRLQQDVQFTIGSTFRLAAAVWYPVSGKAWSPFEHYSANCEWIPLKISVASGSIMTSSKVEDILSIVSIFVALTALGITLVLGWWVKTHSPRVGFQEVPNL
ncbi:unnamed protein product [Calypogeia fissa]